MGKREPGRVGRRIVDMLELPKELVFNLPVVRAAGREELSIQNHKGLAGFSGESVRINTESGALLIEGSGLVLKQITSESVIIAGRLKKVEFL